ncbi:hypothetical protein G7043_40325 [Lentzea sp. NEAU-D13]|uniref:Uncharacterized protein n=1 Tax=Lentzea alba TaxID=2714351 RepID=A0A7C9RXD7_9PSEU|nr:hypothetical protein [Lentzea alba]NGY65170.1 hypothetical protein [Lentzea alba]
MWSEVVVFVPGADAKSARRRLTAGMSPTVVDRGGLHVLVHGKPVEVYFDEPTWDSYTQDEQEHVRRLLPDAEPVLVLFFDREALVEVLRMFQETEAYVDDGQPGDLVLTSLAQYVG